MAEWRISARTDTLGTFVDRRWAGSQGLSVKRRARM